MVGHDWTLYNSYFVREREWDAVEQSELKYGGHSDSSLAAVGMLSARYACPLPSDIHPAGERPLRDHAVFCDCLIEAVAAGEIVAVKSVLA